MRLNIQLDGALHEVTPRPSDLVKFERQYDIAASSLSEDTRLEYIFFIAWCAMCRIGNFSGSFDDFLDLADLGDVGAPLEPPASLNS